MRALGRPGVARRGSGGRGRRASGEGARDEGSRNKSLFPVSRSSCTQTTLACSPCLDVFRVYCIVEPVFGGLWARNVSIGRRAVVAATRERDSRV